MSETRIDDRDRDDESDDTSAGLKRRLERIDRVMARTLAAIDKVKEAGGVPPDDAKPTLHSIKDHAARIGATADEILRKMTV